MPQEQKNPVPLLFISDSISGSSGLARITRDLATRIHANMSDVFRVGTAGFGGPGSQKYPFPQYTFEGVQDWMLPSLPDVWEDFAGKERGILFFIWDLSRIGWFSQPATLCSNPQLRQFLSHPPFEKWLYTPLDASGPNDKLTLPLKRNIYGFDRILAYGKWAADILDNTMDVADEDRPQTHYLPHGIDSSIFYERNRSTSRAYFGPITDAGMLINRPVMPIDDDEVLVGIVATNQSRKDWALGLEAVSILAETHKIRLWIHTDALEKHWSIPAILYDFGLVDKAMISLGVLSDDKMAQAYSACDLTFGIGLGEGFGYPISESLFCGTPCVHGNYGGAPEWMSGRYSIALEMLVEPAAYRYEGVYSCKRPVFRAEDWAEVARGLIGFRMNHNGDIDWNHLWPEWEHWFRGGLK